MAKTNIDVTSKQTGIQGPEVRETWLHRRTEVIRVTVSDLQDISDHSKEEVLLFAVGNFFLAGAAWLGIDKLIDKGPTSPVFLVCVVSVIFGGVLVYVGWRQFKRKHTRLTRLLGEVEEQERR